MHWSRDSHEARALFGVVQGSTFAALRTRSAEALLDLGFEGFAVGGLSVGEPKSAMFEVLEHTLPLLPDTKPRYLMAVGTPRDIVRAVALGVDMFDCVLPTRNARNGCLFTSEGRLLIKNAAFADDERPPDPDCTCLTCSRYSRAYLRHLYVSGEYLSATLNTMHNVTFYLDMMRKIDRQGIKVIKAGENLFADMPLIINYPEEFTVEKLIIIDINRQRIMDAEVELIYGKPPILPLDYILYQNYPNPFNPSSSVRFEVPVDSKVMIKIFDILGREVKTLFDDPVQRGRYTLEWEGLNESGMRISSGTYHLSNGPQ